MSLSWWRNGGGGNRDADAARFISPEPLDLGGKIERPDRGARSEVVGCEEMSGNDPHHFELEAVGVPGIEALGGAVIAGADERFAFAQHPGKTLELTERVDLPGKVVEPDRRPPGVGRLGIGADLEHTEVVIVRGIRSLHEGGPRHRHDDSESERIAVELGGPLDVADIQHGVIESMNTHRGCTT